MRLRENAEGGIMRALWLKGVMLNLPKTYLDSTLFHFHSSIFTQSSQSNPPLGEEGAAGLIARTVEYKFCNAT